MKQILHIANDFLGSAVYKNLFTNLGSQNIYQLIYTAYNPKKIKSSAIRYTNIPNSKIIASPILSLYSRINFYHKIKKITKDLILHIQTKKIELVHAHTWYSDGAVAYELYKRYGLRYVVTVRNTDINVFFKYFIHLRKYGLNILNSADKVIFISPNYKLRLYSHYYFQKNNLISALEYKSIILPNGVDSFWLENVFSESKIRSKKINLIYVGKFDSGKNVKRLIAAVQNIYDKKQNINLTLVGGGGNEHNSIIKLIDNKASYIQYLGNLSKEELLRAYRSHDIFAMPSLHETFGLVYIEALLQGLPVLYTENEGIDGYYFENIGEKVNPLIVSSIENKILKIYHNYYQYNYDKKTLENNHNWVNIAISYRDKVYRLK